MKKVISILMAVLMIMSVVFVFASCSSKKYKDTDATLPSSTVQDETVTNSNGETVHATQSATQSANQSANQNSNSNGKDSKTTTQKADKSNKNTVAKKGKSSKKEKTTKKNSAQKATKKDEKADDTSSQTTEQSTTEKPKAREVFLFVELPNKSNIESKLYVRYKRIDDKEYEHLMFEDKADKKKEVDYDIVKLDGKTVKKYSLGKIKGDVKVVIHFSEAEISNETNSVVIKSDEDRGTISPVVGVDVVDGGLD